MEQSSPTIDRTADGDRNNAPDVDGHTELTGADHPDYDLSNPDQLPGVNGDYKRIRTQVDYEPSGGAVYANVRTWVPKTEQEPTQSQGPDKEVGGVATKNAAKAASTPSSRGRRQSTPPGGTGSRNSNRKAPLRAAGATGPESTQPTPNVPPPTRKSAGNTLFKGSQVAWQDAKPLEGFEYRSASEGKPDGKGWEEVNIRNDKDREVTPYPMYRRRKGAEMPPESTHQVPNGQTNQESSSGSSRPNRASSQQAAKPVEADAERRASKRPDLPLNTARPIRKSPKPTPPSKIEKEPKPTAAAANQSVASSGEMVVLGSAKSAGEKPQDAKQWQDRDPDFQDMLEKDQKYNELELQLTELQRILMGKRVIRELKLDKVDSTTALEQMISHLKVELASYVSSLTGQDPKELTAAISAREALIRLPDLRETFEAAAAEQKMNQPERYKRTKKVVKVIGGTTGVALAGTGVAALAATGGTWVAAAYGGYRLSKMVFGGRVVGSMKNAFRRDGGNQKHEASTPNFNDYTSKTMEQIAYEGVEAGVVDSETIKNNYLKERLIEGTINVGFAALSLTVAGSIDGLFDTAAEASVESAASADLGGEALTLTGEQAELSGSSLASENMAQTESLFGDPNSAPDSMAADTEPLADTDADTADLEEAEDTAAEDDPAESTSGFDGIFGDLAPDTAEAEPTEGFDGIMDDFIPGQAEGADLEADAESVPATEEFHPLGVQGEVAASDVSVEASSTTVTELSAELGKPEGYIEHSSEGYRVTAQAGSETNSIWQASEAILQDRLDEKPTDAQINDLKNYFVENVPTEGAENWIEVGQVLEISDSQLDEIMNVSDSDVVELGDSGPDFDGIDFDGIEDEPATPETPAAPDPVDDFVPDVPNDPGDFDGIDLSADGGVPEPSYEELLKSQTDMAKSQMQSFLESANERGVSDRDIPQINDEFAKFETNQIHRYAQNIIDQDELVRLIEEESKKILERVS